MKPVISREYVEKNYIHKNKLYEIKKELEKELKFEQFREPALLQIDLIDRILKEVTNEI